MGVIVGLVLGAGVLLVWMSFFPSRPRTRRPRAHPLQDLLTQAGWYGVPRHVFVLASIALGLLAGALTLLLTGTLTVAAAFALIAAGIPPTARAEEISLEGFCALAREVAK